MAGKACSELAATAVPKPVTPVPPARTMETLPEKPVRRDETMLRLSTDELVRLAPRLRTYPATPVPT